MENIYIPQNDSTLSAYIHNNPTSSPTTQFSDAAFFLVLYFVALYQEYCNFIIAERASWKYLHNSFFSFFFSSDVQCSCCPVNRWIFSGRNADPFWFINRERPRQGMISEQWHILPWFLCPAVCLSRLLSLRLTFLLFICHFCPSANTLWWHFEKLWHSPSI